MNKTDELKSILHLQDDCNVLVFDNEEQWLRNRRSGIGGSETGAIMGLSKYSTPLQVYKEKVDGITKDMSDNAFVKKGKDLEPLIRNMYVVPHMRELGYRVLYPNCAVVSKESPWLQATPDAFAIPDTLDEEPDKSKDPCIIIEIKWVSEYAEENWYGEEYGGVPSYYYAQVQHYMYCTGASRAIVCALFDKTWEMHYFDVIRDIGFIKSMLEITKFFWYNNICTKIPPKAMPSKDEYAVLSKPSIEDESLKEYVNEYVFCKKQANEFEGRMEAAKDKLVAAYLDGKYPPAPCFVNVSDYETESVDTAKLKKEYPEVYENCKKKRTAHRVRIEGTPSTATMTYTPSLATFDGLTTLNGLATTSTTVNYDAYSATTSNKLQSIPEEWLSVKSIKDAVDDLLETMKRDKQ